MFNANLEMEISTQPLDLKHRKVEHQGTRYGYNHPTPQRRDKSYLYVTFTFS